MHRDIQHLLNLGLFLVTFLQAFYDSIDEVKPLPISQEKIFCTKMNFQDTSDCRTGKIFQFCDT